MPSTTQKATVTLDGVPLAGTQTVAWRFVAGVTPYTAVFSVHRSAWSRLASKKGQPLTLAITDSRGVETRIEHVYILHEAPSDSPHRAAFVVADRRWLWPYKLVVRDYNMPRKTGNRTALLDVVPVELQQAVDEYNFLTHSLNKGKKWTAQQAVVDVLELIEPDKAGPGGQTPSHRVESFPIADTGGHGVAGQFTLQGVALRDSGDVALSRLLSFVPGAEVYIDARGTAVVFNAADLTAVESFYRTLPESTYEGDAAVFVDRKKIRPRAVVVHYQREVECLFRFSDTYGGTAASLNRNLPYLENVLPTVDPKTTVTEFNAEAGKDVRKDVPPATWVRVDKWLEAMQETKPASSFPWTFDTIRIHWLKGDLEGVLGAKGLDLDPEANVSARVNALREHFRQTFRINRRYMDRIREILPLRVALLDPVTGTRGPASVWGQICIIPSRKDYMTSRAGADLTGVYRNVDYLAPSAGGQKQIISTAPGPASVNIIDAEVGIFRLDWVASPYGLTDAYIPCHLVDGGTGGSAAVVSRDLAKQDSRPMGAGMKIESGTNGIYLKNSMRVSTLMTIVPAAPNNHWQFHQVTVEAKDVQAVFRKEFRIQSGEGPVLEVFVPPGEVTARFAWQKDNEATATIQQLLGLTNEDDPGIKTDQLPGFVLANHTALKDHAISVAAEMLAAYADNVEGQVVTRVPDTGVKLVGNMSGASVRVSAAPSAKVDAVHQFPGQQRPISRLAVMAESTRRIVLGTIPFR